MDLTSMSARVKICVLGAGISGLSSAVQIQDTGLDAEVTIVADEFMYETTSSAAGGIWIPHALGNTPEHLLKQWSDATFSRLRELYMSEYCSETGITKLSGYVVYKNDDPHHSGLNPFWRNTAENFQVLSPKDLQAFPNHKTGIFFTTYLSESAVYMKFLTNTFKNRGGIMQRMKVNNLNELQHEFDIIVNCVGIRAREFNNDKECMAICGQVVRVKAPWVKHFYDEGDGPSYIVPVIDEVVLGRTHQVGKWDRDADPNDKAEILKRTSNLLPSLKGAEFKGDRVGIRPGRSSVRLEREDILNGNKKIPVIHNYGHGGSGFTLHWGCSQDVARLVLEAARETVALSKL